MTETGSSLLVELDVGAGRRLQLRFDETTLTCRVVAAAPVALSLAFAWDPARTTLTGVTASAASYRWQGFDYQLRIARGAATATADGLAITAAADGLVLLLAQPT
jgi:hypothetical protein